MIANSAGNCGFSMVEPRGIEPLTSTMPLNEPVYFPPFLLEQVKHMTETQMEQEPVSVPVGPKIADLSREAFLGRVTFLLEAAEACDFSAPVLPSRKRPTLYTYFIGSEHGAIKIGSARDVHQRLTVLQTGNPEPLYIYAVADGGYEIEADLHSEFAADRLVGEWFARSDRLLRRIILLQEQERAAVAALRAASLEIERLTNG